MQDYRQQPTHGFVQKCVSKVAVLIRKTLHAKHARTESVPVPRLVQWHLHAKPKKIGTCTQKKHTYALVFVYAQLVVDDVPRCFFSHPHVQRHISIFIGCTCPYFFRLIRWLQSPCDGWQCWSHPHHAWCFTHCFLASIQRLDRCHILRYSA